MRIEIVTPIRAAPDRCFDLARDITFHVETMRHTGERAVGGRTSGLIELGETVTSEGRHFGVRQRMTVKITAMDRPNHFRDEAVAGPFGRFIHDHVFVATDPGCTMTDRLDFRSPLGPVGAVVDRLVIGRYLRRLLRDRAELIRSKAEAVDG